MIAQDNIIERPLGEAFLCLQGAIDNIKNAITLNDPVLTFKRRIDLLQEVRIFESALNKTKIKSIINQHYQTQGAIEITHAFFLLKHASEFLSSHLQSV